MVGPRLGEGRDVRIDRGNHQMHIEGQTQMRTQRHEHRRPERDVRHEMAVHDVQVQPIGAGRLNGAGLILQPAEIGGEQAGRDDERRVSGK